MKSKSYVIGGQRILVVLGILSTALPILAAGADVLVKFDGAEMPQYLTVSDTAQRTEFRDARGCKFDALVISSESQISGQIAESVDLSTGSIALYLKPLDWDLGIDDGWRMLVNWRAALLPDFSGQSLTLRGAPDGRLAFMIGNFEDELFDLLYFGLGDQPAPAWHHVAITWDENEIVAYVNGEEVERKARATEAKASQWPDRFVIGGGHWSGVEQGSTAVTDLLIKSKVLGQQAVRDLCKSRKDIPPSNCQCSRPDQPSPDFMDGDGMQNNFSALYL